MCNDQVSKSKGDLKMQDKTSQNKWKQKAIERRKEIARLKKRNAEVVASRAYWKQKYKSTQMSHQQLTQQKARGHQYPIVLVWLCLYIYNRCHCSLRTCSEIVAGSALLLQINCRRPQAASIRNWVIKYGFHCYYQADTYCGEWVLIIDEIGPPKRCKYRPGKALTGIGLTRGRVEV